MSKPDFKVLAMSRAYLSQSKWLYYIEFLIVKEDGKWDGKSERSLLGK